MELSKYVYEDKVRQIYKLTEEVCCVVDNFAGVMLDPKSPSNITVTRDKQPR